MLRGGRARDAGLGKEPPGSWLHTALPQLPWFAVTAAPAHTGLYNYSEKSGDSVKSPHLLETG